MASEGPRSPATGANVTGVGTLAWSNPGNIVSSNNVRATRNMDTGTTNYLQGTNFGFSIPDGATIDGIVVEWELGAAFSDDFGWAYDAQVRLVKGGSIVGDNKARPSSSKWPATDAYVSYGSSSDLWGTTWTPADISASNFGAAIAATGTELGPEQATVDHVRITVYYTEGGGGGGTNRRRRFFMSA